jgi:hypothetical protein
MADIKNKNSEKGWKPMPLGLKITFILFILSIFGFFMSFKSSFATGMMFFGAVIAGVPGVILSVILTGIGSFILLWALWNRPKWGWVYILSYFSYLLLNLLFSWINMSSIITRILATTSIPLAIPDAYSTISLVYSITFAFSMIFYIVFFILIYKQKPYFNR